jgi:hypothetical protein
MKLKLSLIITCACLFISCQDQQTKTAITNETSVENTPLSLEGTWELVSYHNYQENVAVDTFESDDEQTQIKMYTKNHFMWSKKVPNGNEEWHGFGTYVQTDSTLSETIKYGSAAMQNLISNSDQFFYQLKLEKDSYSQIVTDDEGYRIYSENYRRIE